MVGPRSTKLLLTHVDAEAHWALSEAFTVPVGAGSYLLLVKVTTTLVAVMAGLAGSARLLELSDRR